ncbi:ribosome maturation factor RimP [Sphingobium xanthum]|uniref:ribosome maturation protein RimP n=1 Tax=Sphingobium xanthum TaxID=1387165 RepID=UPI001C8BEC63
MSDIAPVVEIVEAEAKALGFDVVRVILFGKDDDRTLQIMAERPETRQLTIDDCAALSRGVSARLDALEEAGKDPIEGAYRLEVSSPGIDRPLTRLKDFADWSGHEARVTFAEAIEGGRKQVKAVLAGVDGSTVLLDDPKSGRVVTAFSNVASAKLVLTDALISATVPLSTEGADEIVTQEQED